MGATSGSDRRSERYDDDKDFRALRGDSWFRHKELLHRFSSCFRLSQLPENLNICYPELLA
ncbi:MAG: hypothetical protein JW989_08750 [Chlorobiaceae bacterium]|nr:hypothetical protein [Chlorobiaceae bacterium]